MSAAPDRAAVMTPLDAPVFANRYRLARSLKAGYGVDTYVAVESGSGACVVVKTIDTELVPPAVRLRFQHETQVLRHLTGLGLGRLLDAGRVEDRLYLVQEFVPGQTLAQLLSNGRLDVLVSLRIAHAVASALDTAHGASVCHRDVKPANIIVTGLDPIESVTLIDFGFARSPKLDESIRAELVGTVRYLAPEAAGLLTNTPDERSDLYSLGVVLFECLSGQPVFTGDTVSDLLRQHLSAPAPELRSIGVAVPRAVEDVVQRLLRKDPAERYQSAAALAGDLSELIAALEAGQLEPQLVVGRRDRRSSLTDPGFVGRHDEVNALSGLVADLTSGAGGLITLEADSGGGKSRLLNEVAQLATEAGAVVVSGQGVALAAQRPFTLLHGVADDLVALFDADLDARDAVSQSLRDVAPAIVRALPALAPVLGGDTEQDTGPEEFGELRSITALRRLLCAVPSADRPVLVVLDDCQWADALTCRVLSELFAATESHPHLAVIAAFRSEEVAADHPLRGVHARHHVTLGPLSPSAMATLAESMAGPLPQPILETVVRLADGNPFMGAAVVRGLVESGALVGTDDGWAVDEARLNDVQAARRSAPFLVGRLELLAADALALLSAGAVLGKQFDIATATTISGSTVDAAAVLADARRRRLVWVDDESGRCRFFHDKIREALLERLSESDRTELHSRAADVLVAASAGLLEEDGADTVFDVAYHLDAAGRSVEALPYALRAAGLSRTRYALDAAVSYYRMAARAVTDDALRITVSEGLGDVLTLQGVYGDAESYLNEARALVTDRVHAAALDGKLGGLAFKQGDIPQAKERLEGAVVRLGRRIPRRTSTLLLALVWQLLVQVAHTIAPKLFVGRTPPDDHEAEFLAMRLYSSLAYLYWFHSGKLPCAWVHLREMNLAERFGPSAELAQAYSEHAPIMTMLPWFARGIRYASRSHAIRTSRGDVWGQGQSLNFTGVIRYAASDFEEARTACTEAIRLLRQTGDQWEVNTATWNLALCHLRTGDLTGAATIASDLFYSASRIGDQTSAGIALSVWTRAVEGRIDGALIDAELARGSEDTQTTAELHLASALRFRAEGDLVRAAASIQTARQLVADAGLRQEYVAPIYPWCATILREIAEHTPRYADARRRRARLRECARAVRRARRSALSYRNNAPHALREGALVAALRGHDRRATRLLLRSIRIAVDQDARYEAALSGMALAEISTKDGETSARLDEARETVARFHATAVPVEVAAEPTISLFDRFANLLAVGRAITAATTYRGLEEIIRESTLSLLRAERCHLVPVGALLHQPLTTDSGAELPMASRRMIAEAVDSRHPVAAIDDADPNESLLLAGVRSAIAAPIFVQGEAVSCIYATHRHVGELFGDDEIQLADFIATLAGAAFEHLLGSETRFRSLAQNSSDVITLLDRDGIVLYQSLAVSRVFGLAADAMLGQPISTWLHPGDLDAFGDAIAATLPGGDGRVECRQMHADHSYRDVEIMITNLLDEPTVGALVLNTRDVTDRKQAEEQLREQNIELEKASRAKDMFLASMSHELRTPLNAIIGFTGVLLTEHPGPLNDVQTHQLRTVEQSGKHLLTIINDILDVARIESGTIELKLEPIDCASVVHDVATTLRPLADEKGIDLIVAVPEEKVVVGADARALGQILINLVANGIKFTDQGHVRIELREGDHSHAASIVVTDTGPGISEAERQRIFNAFERGSETTRSHKEGTGLGLYVSHKLAELIDASIGVDNVPGSGASFTVTLAGYGNGES